MVGAETSNLGGVCAGFRGVPLAAPMEVHLSLTDCKFLKIFICKISKELIIMLWPKGEYFIAVGNIFLKVPAMLQNMVAGIEIVGN